MSLQEEFERTILKDLELMEIFGDVLSHSSDYFDLLYGYGVKIIKEGHAYADDTPAEQVRLCFNAEVGFLLTVDRR